MRFERPLNGFVDAYLGSPSISRRIGSASLHADMSENSDESDEFDNIPDTKDGRLSRSLQSWKENHTWTTVEPLEKVPKEPLFSGKLGKKQKSSQISRVRVRNAKSINNTKSNSKQRPKTAPLPLRRVLSDDSITTSLSLLTCSSVEKDQPEEEVVKGKRRRRRKQLSRTSSRKTIESPKPEVSTWTEIATKKTSNLKNIFRQQAVAINMVGIIAGEDDNDESEAFRMFDKDEQEAVFKSGSTRGIKFVNKTELQRSSSVTDMYNEETEKINNQKHLKKRLLSANAKKSWGPPLDVAQIKRDKLNKLMAAEQAKQQQEKERLRRVRRHLLNKSSGQRSLTNMTPSAKSMMSSNTSATPSVITASSNVQSLYSEHSSDLRTETISEKHSHIESDDEKIKNEVKAAVWKNDREILEIDLKRELTAKVKDKIASTRSALKLATGYGDDNEQRKVVGPHEEFPNHAEDDFSHKPRIIQKMRISPHLSNIIHDDIQVRMGRPRYHEIRLDDLEQWNKGLELDRAHRNLKVFNWLHSLRNVTFTSNIVQDIVDEPPVDDSVDLELLHVESADEPDLKPLFRQYEVRIL